MLYLNKGIIVIDSFYFKQGYILFLSCCSMCNTYLVEDVVEVYDSTEL